MSENGGDPRQDFRTLIERLPGVFYTLEKGEGSRWSYVSPQVEKLIGFLPKELLNDPDLWMRQVHPEDRPMLTERETRTMLGEGEAPSLEYRVNHRDGSIVWVLDQAVLETGPDGTRRWQGVIHDVTDRKQSESRMQRDNLRHAAIAQLGEQALAGTEADHLMEKAISLVQEVDGIEHAFIWERPQDHGMLMLRAGPQQAQAATDWRALSAGPDTHAAAAIEHRGHLIIEDWAAEKRFGKPAVLAQLDIRSTAAVTIGTGEKQFGVLEAHSSEPRAFGNEDTAFLAAMANILADAAERRFASEKLRRQVLHDPLTGLPNRLLFIEAIDEALAGSFASGTPTAVLFLDLDRFKLINDSLGHHAGDDLLRAVAPRLRKQLRSGDTVARFGGDEFGVLVTNLADEAEAMAIAERIRRCFDSPFTLADVEHFVSASVGIAVAAAGSAQPGDAEAMIRDADAAMYRAKDRGRARCELFDNEMRVSAVRRLAVERELRLAIEREELVVHYQPVVALTGGEITGFEALVRWRHPERGLLQPGEFISVAEDSGLIEPIGRWVQEQACMQVLSWQQSRPDTRPIDVSVNLSAKQLAHRNLPATVAEVLERTGLSAHHLRLEVTESLLIEESGVADEMLEALHRLGVKLVLDDFGTGYSSLAYLDRFPFDCLKIDRSFIEGIGMEQESGAIVEAIIGMARALSLDVVAEGVENRSQLHELERLGCDFAQGYLFARPLPEEEVLPLLHGNAAATAGLSQSPSVPEPGVGAEPVRQQPESLEVSPTEMDESTVKAPVDPSIPGAWTHAQAAGRPSSSPNSSS